MEVPLKSFNAFQNFKAKVHLVYYLNRKKQKLLANFGTTEWLICLVAVVKVMRGYWLLNLCPMKLLQNIYFTVSTLLFDLLVLRMSASD